MNAIRSEFRGLQLTARGRLARDTAAAIAAVPVLYAALLASIYLLEGMGL